MAPTNGSDSERLMAEIEAFLATGEAPPPAPEPAPSPLPPTRPYRPDALDPTAGGSAVRRRHPNGSRLSAPFGRLPDLGLVVDRIRSQLRGRSRNGSRGAGRVGGRVGAGDRVRLRALGADRHPAGVRWSGRAGGGDRSTAPSGAPPHWTPARALGVVAVLLGLILLPVVWANRGSHVNPDGPDHASAAPAGPGYTFLRVNRSGTPVRWNPCLPIYYQLDLTAAPSWATADIARALAAISSATGMDFVYEGPTNQFPTAGVPVGAGTTQSPVVIAWATADESRQDSLPTDLASAASSSADPSSSAASSSSADSSSPGADALAHTEPVVSADELTGHGVYVAGSVVISAAASQLPSGFGSGSDGVLLLHQLARLVGLNDVTGNTARGEVMDPQVLSSGVTRLGSGDLAGLRRLGSASGCLNVPANGSLEPVI